LYPTAPFVRKEFLREGFEKITTHKYNFVFSATTFAFPPQRSIKILTNDFVEANFKDEFLKRSQDLDEWYHDAGQFYWGTPNSFKKYSSVGKSISSIVKLNRKFVQDIDTLEDWEYAEFLYQFSLSQKLIIKKEYNYEEHGSRSII
jgi:CMP-N-acetylneuraminic acid synthetase